MSILFPFYDSSKHNFLIEKWWFRALIVIYIGIFLLSIGGIWNSGVSDIYYKCINEIKYPRIDHYNKGDITSYFNSQESKTAQLEVEKQKQACDVMAQRAWLATNVLKNAIVIPLIIHYILQLIFFTIIIDFITLGNKTKNN